MSKASHRLFPLPGTPPFPCGQEPKWEKAWSSEWRVACLEDSEGGGKGLRWGGRGCLRKIVPGIHRPHEEFGLSYQSKEKQLQHLKWRNNMTGFAFLKDALFWEQVTGRRAGTGISEDNLSDWFVLRTLYLAGIALDVCELTLPHSMWLGFRAGFVGMLQRTSSVSQVPGTRKSPALGC